ncbi:aspartic peptidase domain-containing protein [Immersiella caudata]|uniref:Aspartic peptidase domain-containing protein n=1 Tax=Immersiella caudata TaxID=314043 RepID=A0AA39WVD8_9PEZI|nr:aspartic peptidase domain-containing protein [Immersiella caudata]
MPLLFLLRAVALHFLVTTAASAHLLLPFSRERNIARATEFSAELPIAASGHVFVINATVGTPGQPVSLLLSTSSPHTWVPKSDVMPCQTRYDPRIGFYSSDSTDGSQSACTWGIYNTAKSSTARTAEQVYLEFVVAYTDTINVDGLNVTDTFAVGGIKIEDFSMGVVSSTSHSQWIGMLGLGNDGTTNYPRYSPKYRPNFIDRLVSSGKIISPGYSIWLNDAAGSSGNLLLGAIDQAQYDGELVRLNANQPYDPFPSAFRVNLVAVNTNDEKPAKLTDRTVVTISPSETFSYLPDTITESIMTAVGATWNETIKRATIPCNAGARSTANVHFQLEGPDGPILNTRISDFVVPAEVSRWEIATRYTTILPKETCLFGIQKHTAVPGGGGPQYNLGSSILRRTYMVFDAHNKDIALAPIKSKSTTAPAFAQMKQGVIPFETLGARIPLSRLYCTGGSCDANPPPNTQSTASGDEGNTSGGSGSSGMKTTIIAVVVPIVALALLVPAGFIFWRRRQRQQAARMEAVSQEKVFTTDTEEGAGSEGSDYGFKVTVSSGGHGRKVSTPLELYLGAPGALPIIPEERLSQCWELEGSKANERRRREGKKESKN